MEVYRIVIEIILIIFIIFIGGYFTMIIHELGHAILALVLTRDQVKITLGKFVKDYEGFKIASLGRLSIVVGSFNPFIGWTSYESQIIRNKKIIIIAGGPIASLVFLLTLSVIDRNIGDELLFGIFVSKSLIAIIKIFAKAMLMSSIIPIKNNYYISDGYKILELIRPNKEK